MTSLLLLVLSQSVFVPVTDGGVWMPVACGSTFGAINLAASNTFTGALVAAGAFDVQGNLNVYSTVKFVTGSSGNLSHQNENGGFVIQGNRSDSVSSNVTIRGRQVRSAGPEFDVLSAGGANLFQVDAKGDIYLGNGYAATSCNGGGSVIDATGISGHPLVCSSPGLYATHMGRLPAHYQGIHGNNTFSSENCLVQGGYLGEFANKCSGSSADKKLMVNDLGFLLWPSAPTFADLPPCGSTDGGVMVDGGPWVTVTEGTFGYVLNLHALVVCSGGWRRVSTETP